MSVTRSESWKNIIFKKNNFEGGILQVFLHFLHITGSFAFCVHITVKSIKLFFMDFTVAKDISNFSSGYEPVICTEHFYLRKLGAYYGLITTFFSTPHFFQSKIHFSEKWF